MWMRSAPATASDGEAATRAPNCSRGRAFESVRFHTVTCSPRRSMPSTIPLPSSPVPMNATFAMRILPLQSIAMRRLTHCLFVAIVAAAVGDRPAKAGHYRDLAEAGRFRDLSDGGRYHDLAEARWYPRLATRGKTPAAVARRAVTAPQ